MEDEQVVQEVVETQAIEQPATEAAVEQEAPVQQAEAEKVFTQAQLDEIIKKRLDREFRKRDRIAQAPIPVVEAPSLDPNTFEDVDKYAEALADQKLAQKEEREKATRVRDAYFDKEDSARDKYDDFDQVAHNPGLRVTSAMADAIRNAAVGPDIAYWLGSNPKEADRISQLSPVLQIKEIGKIEARIEDKPPTPKKTTTAPPPIKPVTPDGGVKTFDPSDPRSIQHMSPAEWIEARNRQLMDRARR